MEGKNNNSLVVQASERYYHPFVVNFLKGEKIKCFDARMGVGHGYVGYADVFGLKDIGGEFKSGVIGYSVEVKKSNSSIAKKLGQALGYSLFSHRCYLAVAEKFEDDHIEMANRLGVGLIEINGKKCEEILTAQHHEPINDLFLSAVYNLGWARCDMCNEFFQHKKSWTRRNPYYASNKGKVYHSRINKNYDVYYTTTKRRYPVSLCPDCLKNFKF